VEYLTKRKEVMRKQFLTVKESSDSLTLAAVCKIANPVFVACAWDDVGGPSLKMILSKLPENPELLSSGMNGCPERCRP